MNGHDEPAVFDSDDPLADDREYAEWVERQHQEAVALMEEEQEWPVI